MSNSQFYFKKIGKHVEDSSSSYHGFGVQLGNGDQIPTKGVCRGVRLHLQVVEIIEDFIPLNSRNIDVSLGIQWLETLGG